MAGVTGSARPSSSRRPRAGESCLRGIALAVLAALCAAGSAAAAVPYADFSLPVNDFPQGISAGDCNDDLLPDLLVADQGSDDVTILRNIEDGNFAYLTSVAITSAPRAAVCADFNKDGLTDIAAVSRGNATLTIYKKKDTGGYTSLVTVPVGNQPNALAAKDLNEDGNMDAVVVNSKSNTLTILLGDGAGAFPLVNTIGLPSAATSPTGLAVADFNLDGHLDLAVAARGDGAPVVLIYLAAVDGVTMKATGTFTLSPIVVPSPPDPRALATADLDKDGRPDLGLLSTDSTVTLYLGTNTGGFVNGGVFNVRPNAQGLTFADFDGDTLQDAALTFSDTNSVQVLLATGPAQFPSAGSGPSSVVVNPLGKMAARSSLTDEGLPITDLLSSNVTTRALESVGMSDPGTLAVAPLLALASPPVAVELADMNGDGLQDAVVVASGKHGLELSILPGNATGGYDPAPTDLGTCGDGIAQGTELCDDGNVKNGDGCSKACAPELGRKLYSLDAADVNADGNQDLVVVAGMGDLMVLLGDGAGRFTSVRKLQRVRAKTGAVVGDFDADGFSDIIVMPRSRSVKGLSLLANDGTGQFTTVLIPVTAKLGTQMLSADLDRNGFLDLAVTSLDKQSGIVVLLNDGTGILTNVGTVPAPKGIAKLAAADFDEDGWLDLLATFTSTKQSALVFSGLTTGAFGSGQAALDGKLAANATIVDINNDRHQDLVVCNPGAVTSCEPHYGDGKGAFASTPPTTGNYIGRQLRAVAVVDLDGDTVPDFIGVSRGDNRALMLFRNAAGALTARLELATGEHPRSIAVGDLNGDTLPDIVIVNEGSNDLSIFINQGQRVFQTLARRPLKADGNTPSAVALGDLNGDHKLDIVVTFQLSSNVAVFQNLGGNPETGFPRVASFPTGANPQALVLQDFNGDHVLDVVTVNRDGVPPVPVATATVTGTGTPVPTVTPTPGDTDGATPGATATATKTKTPTPTVTATPAGTGSLTLLLSQPDGSYTSQALRSGGTSPQAVAAVDLNDDQAFDLVVVNSQATSQAGLIAAFLNDGAGHFDGAPVLHRRGREKPRDICAGDFDGDTKPDIAVASLGTNDILILRGDGAGNWKRDERVYPVGNFPRTIFCFDIDGDTKTDVLFGRMNAGDVDFITTGP